MKKKNWFTMVEIILILVIIATALITIIQGISKTTQYISEMRQRTIALNLAKEGIEAVYNIRDTNWRRRSANRDECWLKANPMIDEGGDGCENDTLFGGGSRYAIISTGEPNYYAIKRVSNGVDDARAMDESKNLVNNYTKLWQQIKDIIKQTQNNDSDPHWNFRMHFVEGQRIDHDKFLELQKKGKTEALNQGIYRRWIAGWWIHSKETGTFIKCITEQNPECKDASAKEFRFCSTVIYSSPYQGIVNLCAIMTNFVE